MDSFSLFVWRYWLKVQTFIFLSIWTCNLTLQTTAPTTLTYTFLKIKDAKNEETPWKIRRHTKERETNENSFTTYEAINVLTAKSACYQRVSNSSQRLRQTKQELSNNCCEILNNSRGGRDFYTFYHGSQFYSFIGLFFTFYTFHILHLLLIPTPFTHFISNTYIALYPWRCLWSIGESLDF